MRGITLDEFLSYDIPETEMVMSPFFPTKGIVLLYSAPGVGKTFLSLGIARAVASGEGLLGWYAPKPRRVLYIDGEMASADLQKRLKILDNGRRALPSPKYFTLVTRDLQENYSIPALDTDYGQDAVDPLVEAADLVVVDNLSTLMGYAGDDNTSENWVPVQRWLLSLRARGKSVLLVHHANKGGSYVYKGKNYAVAGDQRGSSKKVDIVDTKIALVRPQDYVPTQGCTFEVHFQKARAFSGDSAEPFEAVFSVINGKADWRRKAIRHHEESSE